MTLTPENKAARRGLFTASEIHKLITPGGKLAQNDTRDKYVMDVAFEKVTGFRRPISSKQMEHGNLHEWEAFELFSRLFPDFCRRNDELLVVDQIGATPDGFVTDIDANLLATIDIKCPYSTWLTQKEMAMEARVFHDYYWQAQCQMYCAGVNRHYLVRYFTPGDILDDDTPECDLPEELRIFWQVVLRNDDDIALMLEAVKIAVEDCQRYEQLITARVQPY